MLPVSCSLIFTSQRKFCATKRLTWLNRAHRGNALLINFRAADWQPFYACRIPFARWCNGTGSISGCIYHFKVHFKIISTTPTLYFLCFLHWCMLCFFDCSSVLFIFFIYFPHFCLFLLYFRRFLLLYFPLHSLLRNFSFFLRAFLFFF